METSGERGWPSANIPRHVWCGPSGLGNCRRRHEKDKKKEFQIISLFWHLLMLFAFNFHLSYVTSFFLKFACRHAIRFSWARVIPLHLTFIFHLRKNRRKNMKPSTAAEPNHILDWMVGRSVGGPRVLHFLDAGLLCAAPRPSWRYNKGRKERKGRQRRRRRPSCDQIFPWHGI